MLQIICFQNIIYRLLSLESLIGPSYSFMIIRRSEKQSKKLGSSVHAVKVCTDEEFPSEFLESSSVCCLVELGWLRRSHYKNNMAGLKCGTVGCEFETEDGTLDQKLKHLELLTGDASVQGPVVLEGDNAPLDLLIVIGSDSLACNGTGKGMTTSISWSWP